MRIPRREEGQGLVEYALILVLIAVVVIVILEILGGSLVLAYARIIGGLNGQVMSGSGQEAIILSYDMEVSGGGGTCTVNVTDISALVVQDGEPLENTAVSIPADATGGSPSNPSGTTNGNGVVSGLSTGSFNASCGGTFTLGLLSTGINP